MEPIPNILHYMPNSTKSQIFPQTQIQDIYQRQPKQPWTPMVWYGPRNRRCLQPMGYWHYVPFCPQYSHCCGQYWGHKNGDRMGTKNVNDFSQKGLLKKLLLVQLMSISKLTCMKADCLSMYVVPLHFWKGFLYYDTMHACPSSTIVIITKWTFFWILLDVPGKSWIGKVTGTKSCSGTYAIQY